MWHFGLIKKNKDNQPTFYYLRFLPFAKSKERDRGQTTHRIPLPFRFLHARLNQRRRHNHSTATTRGQQGPPGKTTMRRCGREIYLCV